MSAARRSLVIGAGIVGLCCARALLREGHAVTVIDRDPAGDKVSFGNAGGLGVTEILPAATPGVIWQAPRWLFDPLGPLSIRPAHLPRLLPWLVRFLRSATAREAARITGVLVGLLAPVYDDMMPLLAELGSAGDLHRVGALWVYETEAGFERDEASHDVRRRHGVAVEAISVAEARRLEPALTSAIARAVVTPGWSHVSDPKRIVDRLRESLQARGVSVLRHEATGVDGGAVITASGEHIAFDCLVVAAGAWSGRMSRAVGDRVLIESERGYNATLPTPGVRLSREVIFAERQFVATPLEMGLRIGGQLAAKRGPDDAGPALPARSRHARRPTLDGQPTHDTRQLTGHRPLGPPVRRVLRVWARASGPDARPHHRPSRRGSRDGTHTLNRPRPLLHHAVRLTCRL
jgi:D-amino-acid dehydrogenase